jgi:hypothetical protein
MKIIICNLVLILIINSILNNRLKKQNPTQLHQFSDDDLKKPKMDKTLNLTQTYYNNTIMHEVDDKTIKNSSANQIKFVTTSSSEKINTSLQNHTINSDIKDHLTLPSPLIMNVTYYTPHDNEPALKVNNKTSPLIMNVTYYTPHDNEPALKVNNKTSPLIMNVTYYTPHDNEPALKVNNKTSPLIMNVTYYTPHDNEAASKVNNKTSEIGNKNIPNSKTCDKKNVTSQSNPGEEIVHYIYNTINSSNSTSSEKKSNPTDNFDGPLILSIVRENENVKVQNTNTENINSHNTYNVYNGPKRKHIKE